MATEVIFDTIKGAQIKGGNYLKRQVRTGHVKGIDVVGAADSLVLNKAWDAIVGQVPFASQHPSNNGTYFSDLFVRPAGTSVSDRVYFEMVYESNQFPVPSAFMLRDGSTMTAYNSRFLPGKDRHKRIITNPWTDPVTGRVVQPNSINHQFLRPARTITVNALIYGKPPPNIRVNMGRVNDAQWMDLPIGYWMVMAIESDQSRQSGYYTYSCSLVTKGNEDWSDIDVLEDPLTGLPVSVNEAEVHAALATDYAYGNHPGNGFTRVCGYETVNFTGLLGFDAFVDDPRWSLAKMFFSVPFINTQ